MMRIGELDFINTLPFRLGAPWKTVACPSPKRLAQWAHDEKIDAGVLPVVEAWRLEDRFESLGKFGIAVKRQAMSVLLFSKRPWAELNGAVIGVTDQSSTSVQLFRVLMDVREGFSVQWRTGFSPSDDGRLVIGDDALAPSETLRRRFPHVTDLAEQWHAWQGGPFVFARWVVRRTVPKYLRDELEESLDQALSAFDASRAQIVRRAAKSLKVSPVIVQDYFNGFNYRLGRREEESEGLFRDLVIGKIRRGCC